MIGDVRTHEQSKTPASDILDILDQEIYRENPLDPNWKRVVGTVNNVMNDLNPFEAADMILKGKAKDAILPVIIARLSDYDIVRLEKAIADINA